MLLFHTRRLWNNETWKNIQCLGSERQWHQADLPPNEKLISFQKGTTAHADSLLPLSHTPYCLKTCNYDLRRWFSLAKKAVPMIQGTDNRRRKISVGLPVILKEHGCFLSELKIRWPHAFNFLIQNFFYQYLWSLLECKGYYNLFSILVFISHCHFALMVVSKDTLFTVFI